MINESKYIKNSLVCPNTKRTEMLFVKIKHTLIMIYYTRRNTMCKRTFSIVIYYGNIFSVIKYLIIKYYNMKNTHGL